MKNLFLTVLIMMAFSVVLFAQSNEVKVNRDLAQLKKKEMKIRDEEKQDRKEIRDIKSREAGYRTLQQFKTDFPGASILHSYREPAYDKVVYEKDGVRYDALYDVDGNLIGTTTIKMFKDLPALAQKNINRDYRRYKIGEVLLYNDNESNENLPLLFDESYSGSDSYFVELKKKGETIVLHVDMDGNVSWFANLDGSGNNG
jgi:hypothetical protein